MITTGGHLGLGCTELPLVWRQLRSIFQACRTRLAMWMSRQISWKCLAARARTSIFLHNVPVTATTSDKHGRPRQSSQAARGQRKSLRNFWGFFVGFLTHLRRLPRTPAVPRIQLGWNEASFSIFFLLVLLLPPSLLAHPTRRLTVAGSLDDIFKKLQRPHDVFVLHEKRWQNEAQAEWKNRSHPRTSV